MSRKDDLVLLINEKARVESNSFCGGIVRVAEKSSEKINYDADNRPVIFDDKYDLFLYHKVRSESLKVIQERGTSKVYDVIANMNVIVFCKNRETCDLIVSAMSTLKDVTLNSIDHDSYKILKQETSITSYDFSKYIFSINYDLKYRSNECTSVCR